MLIFSFSQQLRAPSTELCEQWTVALQKMTAGELRLPIFTEEVYEISIQIELDRMADG